MLDGTENVGINQLDKISDQPLTSLRQLDRYRLQDVNSDKNYEDCTGLFQAGVFIDLGRKGAEIEVGDDRHGRIDFGWKNLLKVSGLLSCGPLVLEVRTLYIRGARQAISPYASASRLLCGDAGTFQTDQSESLGKLSDKRGPTNWGDPVC